MKNVQTIFYKAVKVDETTGSFTSAGKRCPKVQFSIGGVYSVPGEPKLCKNGFHACPTPLGCFDKEYGYELGKDVLLEVEFVGPMKWAKNACKLCGCTLRVLGLATVKINDDQSFQDGLFHGRVKDFFGEVWYAGNLVHREDDLPAEIKYDHYSDNDYRTFKKWYRRGVLHRDGDLPAVEIGDGTREWFRDGVRHRDGDLPAIVHWDGSLEWFYNGDHHREGDKPAAIFIDNVNGGFKYWFVKGVCHREGDLPAEEGPNGFKRWMKHGLLHREGDLPAVVAPFGRQWWRHGKLHRDGDMPASIRREGHEERLVEWYRDGERYRSAIELSIELEYERPAQSQNLG